MRYAECIDDALTLQRRGFVRYTGEVDQTVYDRLGCKQEKKAVWFVKGTTHQCLGCGRRCLLTQPCRLSGVAGAHPHDPAIRRYLPSCHRYRPQI